MLRVNVNVIRDGEMLCSGSFDTTAPEFEAVPTERFNALHGAHARGGADEVLVWRILTFFLVLLREAEEKVPAD
jgi:hypothetical protein